MNPPSPRLRARPRSQIPDSPPHRLALTGSSSQRRTPADRRDTIVNAALQLAADGGYDAVQMRTIAERAGVGVGTVYAHFPSKTHLLAAALTREFRRFASGYDWTGVATTPRQRLEELTRVLHRHWQRQPLLTAAMTRAFVVANTSAAGELDQASAAIEHLLASALGDGSPTATHHQVAGLIADVWLANLRAFIGGRASADVTRDRIDRAVGLLTDHLAAFSDDDMSREIPGATP